MWHGLKLKLECVIIIDQCIPLSISLVISLA